MASEPTTTFDNGTKIWEKDGKLHREDGPAYISITSKEWCYEGKLHREDGPAIITATHQAYYHHGLCHRIDGPAYIHFSPIKNIEQWFYNDGNFTDSYKKWCKDRNEDPHGENLFMIFLMEKGCLFS